MVRPTQREAGHEASGPSAAQTVACRMRAGGSAVTEGRELGGRRYGVKNKPGDGRGRVAPDSRTHALHAACGMPTVARLSPAQKPAHMFRRQHIHAVEGMWPGSEGRTGCNGRCPRGSAFSFIAQAIPPPQSLLLLTDCCTTQSALQLPCQRCTGRVLATLHQPQLATPATAPRPPPVRAHLGRCNRQHPLASDPQHSRSLL
jgi:hypothetical protein